MRMITVVRRPEEPSRLEDKPMDPVMLVAREMEAPMHNRSTSVGQPGFRPATWLALTALVLGALLFSAPVLIRRAYAGQVETTSEFQAGSTVPMPAGEFIRIVSVARPANQRLDLQFFAIEVRAPGTQKVLVRISANGAGDTGPVGVIVPLTEVPGTSGVRYYTATLPLTLFADPGLDNLQIQVSRSGGNGAASFRWTVAGVLDPAT
jgi:hypothetical protein